MNSLQLDIDSMFEAAITPPKPKTGEDFFAEFESDMAQVPESRPEGFLGALGSGVKQTFGLLGTAKDVYSGDTQGVLDTAKKPAGKNP